MKAVAFFAVGVTLIYVGLNLALWQELAVTFGVFCVAYAEAHWGEA